MPTVLLSACFRYKTRHLEQSKIGPQLPNNIQQYQTHFLLIDTARNNNCAVSIIFVLYTYSEKKTFFAQICAELPLELPSKEFVL